MIRHPIGSILPAPLPHPLLADTAKDPWYFVGDANAPATDLIVSGGKVVSLTNRGFTLTSPDAASRHVYDTVNTIGGRPVFALSKTANRRLETTQGVTLGAHDHAIFAVYRHRDTLVSPTSGQCAMFGTPAGGGHSFGASCLGETAGDLAWGGGNGAGTVPQAPLVLGEIVLAKIVVNNDIYLIVDGTPAFEAGTLNVAPRNLAFNITNGLGIGGATDAFSYSAECDVALVLFSLETFTLPRAQAVIGNLASQYGLAARPVRIEAVGDSLTKGTGTTTPETDAYPAVLQAELISNGFTGAVVNNHGVPGSITAEILGNLGIHAIDHYSPRYVRHYVIVSGGTNDISNGITPAVAIANLRAACLRVRAVGQIPVLMTLFPYDETGSSPPGSPLDVKRVTICDEMRGPMVSDGTAVACIDMESAANVLLYGDMHGTAFHFDGTHQNTLGAQKQGFMARDVFLQLLAA